MSGDPSTDPGFVGVRQPDFDQLVGHYSGACSQIEELSHALWSELNGAGLDVSPALRLRDLAAGMRPRAADLKRRQQAIHDMDRQRFGIPVCTAKGTFWALPDDLSALRARMDATTAADLASRAAAGDRDALARLRQYAPEAADPAFAKAFLSRLGAKGTIEIPAALAKLLRDEMDAEDRAGLRRDKPHVLDALKLISTTLAVGTDPRNQAGYVGDQFLDQLKREGRKDHAFPGKGQYTGYQSLATLLSGPGRTLSEPQHPFSRRFMEIVGRDMIDFDRARTSAHQSPHIPDFPRDRPPFLDDLTGRLQLGWALTPDAEIPPGSPPYGGRSDYLADLMHAASLSKDGAQALLDYTPPGQSSTLEYLLHDRRIIWAQTDHGRQLGLAMQTAMSGHDKASMRLFTQTHQILGQFVLDNVRMKGDHQLKIDDGGKTELDQLSGLRNPLAEIMKAHLEEIDLTLAGSDISGRHPAVADSARDYDALLAYASMDDAAFQTLMYAQLARTRIDMDHQLDNHRGVDELLLNRMGTLGHLLAVRKEILAAIYDDQAEQHNTLFKTIVDKGIGYIPIPYANLFATGAKPVYEEILKYGYTTAGDWLSQQVDPTPTLKDPGNKFAHDSDAARKLTRQLLISTTVQHINDLAGVNERIIKDYGFTSGDPRTWDDGKLDAFTRFAETHNVPIGDLTGKAMTRVEQAHNDAISSFD